MEFLQARSVVEGYALLFVVLPMTLLLVLEIKSWLDKK